MVLNYINGEFVQAQSGKTEKLINPATEEVITDITWGDVHDCNAAISVAAAAFVTWSKTNVYQRSAILKKAADIMRANVTAYANDTVQESGKPFAEAKGEWLVAANLFEWFAEEAKRAYGRTIPAIRNDKRMMTIWQPMGVVGVITAWNFPAYNPARAWAAALAAGCTLVTKGSEFTPLSTSNMVKALAEAGLPAGVLNNLNGDAAAIGDAFLSSEDVKKISFTGSTRVGKILMDGASRTNTKLSLELGGNAPVIINHDVNVEALAVSSVTAKLRNAGQVCVSPQRFFVHADIYDHFVEVATNAMQNIKVGYGWDADTAVGPLINQRQQQQVLKVIEDAKQSGAHTASAAIPADKGWFVPPTLLTNVAADNVAVNREIFGPVMPVIKWQHREDVVAWANSTPYGLAAYVWTNNINDAFYFSEALEFGMVGINEWAPHATEAPFGGWKQSGIGHESGSEGLFEYMEKKLISWGGLS
ncbi:NAD-dependent succinate-semialdehyde dehydrogenase [Panacibacter sp. DH6]|uniref:NAD-dependent succinate-semialdehyde dehydrogenase n=1 Tax=Panacibacter microcysteis TaxID=2793269 RepID=A0A931EBN8_9BACT|nr:NAD-dependent succinate-semialdehyde dehydrogenase [Panacibacter microcysteis]MBG9377671.1 NAD-dependent succinate-semialdehyde dehydrogenase [Panacibacter microcysteis]